MAEQQVSVGGPHDVSGTTVLYASLAGIVVGGPVLGMMGFSFLATVTLLLISSPLLIIFSPLFFFAAFVLVAAMAGFAAAAAMALAGISTFAWIFRSFRGRSSVGFDAGITERLRESGERGRVKEEGKDWAGLLQQKVQVDPQEITKRIE